MKTLVGVTLASLVLGLALYFGLRAEAPQQGVDHSACARELERLSVELAQLKQRVTAAERTPQLELAPERHVASGAAAGARDPGRSDTPHGRSFDPAAWLEAYVRSFDDGGEGSEYHRLLVEAHVQELMDGIAGHALDLTQPLPLRIALARMLGKVRPRGEPRATEPLLGILAQSAPRELALAALASLRKVADTAAAARVEALLWRLAAGDVRDEALAFLLDQAGERSNAVILRLLASAPDEPAARDLLRRLDGVDLESALAAFQWSARQTQPVRLAGAEGIGDFDAAEFGRFVEEWLGFETDEQVIAALGGARARQRELAGWSAMQATGAPNADARRDDPHAWASRDSDMGLQWIELGYANPERATAVVVHEVSAGGALVEVHGRDANGHSQLLWSGSTADQLGTPLRIEFPQTGFRVARIRLVLDTNRTPGWNEIDAVELVGVSGGQWAVNATASSTYAQRGRVSANGAAFGEGFGLLRAVGR